jgi:hypothetical protein
MARGRIVVEVIEATPATTSRSDCVFVENAKWSRWWFPARWPGTLIWWRRGDSTFRDFRSGLDYAFIRDALASAWMRSVLSN